MTLWTDEGVADIGYGQSFYPELSPGVIAYALIHGGVRPPDGLMEGRFSWCDLGCGQGVSLNLLAALYPGSRFEGVDALPLHAENARRLAGRAGLDNVTIHQDSFARFAERDGDGFDVVVLHGVLSWVGRQAREEAAAILARRLKPGGVAFASYNLMPGWTALAPIRQLLYRHVAVGEGAMEDRIAQALERVNRLAAVDSGYFERMPGAWAHLAGLARKSPSYLAHEYLNRDWAPLYHADVAELLAGGAGLSYVGPATFADLEDRWALPPEGLRMMAETQDGVLRETIRDTLTMNRFRRDLFVRDPRPLTAEERDAGLRAFPLRAAMLPDDLPAGFAAPQGTVAFGPEHRAAMVTGTGEPETLLGLMAVGALMPSVPGDGQGALRYNRAVLGANREEPGLCQLAAPLLGGGVEVDVLERLFLLAELEEADPAAFAAKVLAEWGQILSGEDAGHGLESRYRRFVGHRRPFMDALGALPKP